MSHLRPIRTEERLIDIGELAELFGCSTDTIDRMRKDGLPFIKWGAKFVRYRPSECVAWLEAQQRKAA